MRAMRNWHLSRYKGKLQKSPTEILAMQSLKKKLAEAQSPSTDFLSVMVDSFRSYGLDPSPSSYSLMINYLGRRSLFPQLVPILKNLEKAENYEVPEAVFAKLIQFYAKADMLDDAVELFFSIPKFSCTPSIRSLNTLLNVLCKNSKGLHLVHDVLLRTPELNIRLESSSYEILLKALCRKGKIRYALDILDVMQQADECMVDPSVYSLILSSLCKQESSTEATKFMGEMRNTGFIPNLLDYYNVINVLVREGKASDAYDILEEMKMEGIRPDVITYAVVLDGFIMVNEFQKADELFDEILLMGITPDTYLYNAYVFGLCKQGDLERARKMIICMERAGCAPDVQTFNILIAEYSKIGDTERCREVMNEITKKGLKWDSHTYRFFVDGLIKKGEIEAAYEVLVDMLKDGFDPPPSSTCHALISEFCSKNLLKEARELLLELLGHCIVPDSSMWEAILSRFNLTYRDVLEEIMRE